jgi:type I restriction enzyme S subunit
LLKEKHALLELYKKGVMQKLFSQDIRFKDEYGNNFPDWEEKKGNEVFRAVSNKNHNSDLPILAITQDQGAIPRDLINYKVQVTENSVASYKVVEKGDFIISLRSFQGGIEYSNYKGICSPAYIILQPSTDIDDDYYRYYLKTNNFIQAMKKRLEGIRDGKILSYRYFSEINLPYPSVQEQQKIAQFLKVIDKKVDLVNQQIEQTQTFKKCLLQQMFVS